MRNNKNEKSTEKLITSTEKFEKKSKIVKNKIKRQVVYMSRVYFVFLISFTLCVLLLAIFAATIFKEQIRQFAEHIGVIEQVQEEITIIEETPEEQEKREFNSQFKNYEGENPYMFVSALLDAVVQNNQRDINTVEVLYNEHLTENQFEILEIKSLMIITKDYNISLEYDENGYMNKVIIEDIE